VTSRPPRQATVSASPAPECPEVRSLREEIRQSKPFESAAEEAAVALLRTTDLVRRRIAAVIEAHDVTTQQYNVLRILRGAGDQGLQTLELASRMIEQAPGITRLIDRLEAKKLVRRERPRGDRRCVICRITASGLELVARLDGPVRSADARAMACLDEAELAQLIGLLARVRATNQNPEPQTSPAAG
jgi:DNA-binding MarR family transcriptional regulator